MFIHAESAIPRSTFESMIRNERDRILSRCTTLGTKTKSLDAFNQMLKNRGHETRYRNVPRKALTIDESPKFFLNIPFVSDVVDSMIRKSLQPLGLRVIISHKNTRLKNLLTSRPKPTEVKFCKVCGLKEFECEATHVVYKMQCNKCNNFYIGSTRRTLHQRLKEHATIKSSLVYQHHCKDRWHTTILYRTNHVQKMRLMEAILIKDQKPQVNGKETIFSGHIVI